MDVDNSSSVDSHSFVMGDPEAVQSAKYDFESNKLAAKSSSDNNLPSSRKVPTDCKTSSSDNNLPTSQKVPTDCKTSSTCHSPKSNKRKKPPCRTYGLFFSGSFSLRRHMRSKHPAETENLSGKCKCNECGFKCHKIGDLRNHLSRNHNVMFKSESVTFNNLAGKYKVVLWGTYKNRVV